MTDTTDPVEAVEAAISFRCITDADAQIAARDAITAYLEALEEAGYVVVPKKPTEEMVEVLACIGLGQWTVPGTVRRAEAIDAYRAMLRAANPSSES